MEMNGENIAVPVQDLVIYRLTLIGNIKTWAVPVYGIGVWNTLCQFDH